MIDPLEVFVPDKISHYKFASDIGVGSFALVKTVVDINTKEIYACKIVPKSKLESLEMEDRFEQEIRVLQQMKHKNITQLYDLIKDEHNFYIIMEYCPKGELFQIIVDRKLLPESEAKIYLAQMADALSFVHSRNACHRDLKPENLLIGSNDQIKITDFGFSRFTNRGALCQTACGSPCYVSPECLSGDPYNGQISDIWSLGVIFFVMCTGKLPWTKRNQQKLFEQIQKGDYYLPKHLSPECQDLIRKMMCVDPEKRITAAGILKEPWMQDSILSEPNVEQFKIGVTLKQLDRFFDKDVSTPLFDEAELERLKSVRNVDFGHAKKLISAPKSSSTSKLPPLAKKKSVASISRKSTKNFIPLKRKQSLRNSAITIMSKK